MVAVQQLIANLAAPQITADDPWPLIWVAWAVTFGTFAVYAFVLVRRGRRLSRQVPGERRRFLVGDGQDGGTHG